MIHVGGGRRDALARRITSAAALATAGTLVAAIFFDGSGSARAQVVPVDPLPSTTTTVPSAPSPPPPGASPAPAPSPKPGQTAPAPPQQKPAPPGAPPVPGAGGGDDGAAPPPGAGPFPANLAAMSRSVRRTKPGNTRALMDAVGELEKLGVSRDEAIRVGMGRFPVGGYATYSHDWWLPRFGPGWRLHQGTDIFAAHGTPVRAPGDGAVRLTNGGLGGISTYVIQDDGTYFYMTHLAGRPEGLKDGARVRTGDVVGYVGASGNAAGGSPHLHFEIHPAPVKVITKGKGKNRTTQVIPLRVKPGTTLPAVDPKPHLDEFLRDALAEMPRVLEAYRASLPAEAGSGAGAVPGEIAAPVVAAGAIPAIELHEVSPLVAQRFTRAPLVALAFVLVVLVGSLTPVVSQIHGATFRAATAGEGAADSSPVAASGGRRRRRARGGADGVKGAAVAPQGRRRRRNRSGEEALPVSEGTKRRRRTGRGRDNAAPEEPGVSGPTGEETARPVAGAGSEPLVVPDRRLLEDPDDVVDRGLRVVVEA